MLRLFRDTRWFLLPTALFALAGAVLLLLSQRGDVVLAVNRWHSPAGDWIFRYATYLGDGLFWAVLLVLLAVFHRREGLAALVIAGVSAGLVQGLKHAFELERPSRVLADMNLHFVEGVHVHGYLSFPSGHTAAAFTGFFLLAAIFGRGRPWLGAVCFVLAAAAGFSRIYLVQHFFGDVYAGALLGVGVGLLWIPARRWVERA